MPLIEDDPGVQMLACTGSLAHVEPLDALDGHSPDINNECN